MRRRVASLKRRCVVCASSPREAADEAEAEAEEDEEEEEEEEEELLSPAIALL
jgi:hypothetical protein